MSTSTGSRSDQAADVTALLDAPPAVISTWTPPRVNLLPTEVFARRAVRAVQRGAVAATAGVLLLVAVAWGVASAQTASEQERLDAANARVQALQAEQSQYADAPRIIKQVEAAEAARAQAMGQDVAWYSYVDSLTRALPAGAWLSEVQTATAPVAASGAAGTAASSIGSVSISAKSLNYEDVAAYLDALAALPGVADAYLTSSTQDDSTGTPVVTFSMTAQITADALSHRYDQDGD